MIIILSMYMLVADVALVDDIISCHEKYKEQTINYGGTFEVIEVAKNNLAEKSLHYIGSFKHGTNGYYIIINENNPKDSAVSGAKRLFGFNKKYYYSLEMGKNSLWRQTEVFCHDDTQRKQYYDRTAFYRPMGLLGITYHEGDISQFLCDNKNRCNITIRHDGKISITSDNIHITSHYGSPSSIATIHNVSMILYPKERHYALDSITFDMSSLVSRIMISEIMQYDTAFNIAYVERREKYSNDNITGEIVSKMYIDMKLHNTAFPEYDFTLSAFGLPEPHGITWERPTPWWIYFGLIGGGCLVGFVLIGVFLRRRYGAS